MERERSAASAATKHVQNFRQVRDAIRLGFFVSAVGGRACGRARDLLHTSSRHRMQRCLLPDPRRAIDRERGATNVRVGRRNVSVALGKANVRVHGTRAVSGFNTFAQSKLAASSERLSSSGGGYAYFVEI